MADTNLTTDTQKPRYKKYKKINFSPKYENPYPVYEKPASSPEPSPVSENTESTVPSTKQHFSLNVDKTLKMGGYVGSELGVGSMTNDTSAGGILTEAPTFSEAPNTSIDTLKNDIFTPTYHQHSSTPDTTDPAPSEEVPNYGLVENIVSMLFSQSSRSNFQNMFRSISTIFYVTHFITVLWIKLLIAFILFSIFVSDVAIVATVFTMAASQLCLKPVSRDMKKNLLYTGVLLMCTLFMLLSHKFGSITSLTMQIILVVLVSLIYFNYLDRINVPKDQLGGIFGKDQTTESSTVLDDKTQIDLAAGNPSKAKESSKIYEDEISEILDFKNQDYNLSVKSKTEFNANGTIEVF